MLSPNSTVAELIDHSCGEWKEALVKQICISFSIFHLLNGDWVVFLLIQFFFFLEKILNLLEKAYKLMWQ